MKKFCTLTAICASLFFTYGCGMKQVWYGAQDFYSIDRGYEKYSLGQKDSSQAAQESNQKELINHIRHLATDSLIKKEDGVGKIERILKATSDNSLAPNKTQIIEKINLTTDLDNSSESKAAEPSIKSQEASFQNSGKIRKFLPPGQVNNLILLPDNENTNSSNQEDKITPEENTGGIGIIWPVKSFDLSDFKTEITENKNGQKITTITGPTEEFIKALSSTASILEMRDLTTEPSFTNMLPTEREVKLGCLPPPKSAAYTKAAELAAEFKQDDKIDAGLKAQFATSVTKLFEESERTLFLQYAMFRLCEMSINAPAGFRNVYPVVIHDLVRRTAEMNQLANKEAELRRIEEEKTRQKELDVKIEELKKKQKELENEQASTSKLKEVAYYNCLNKETSISADERATKCKTMVNQSLE